MRFCVVFFAIIALLAVACEQGELLPNNPPETRIFLDEINLTGEERLNSVVRLHWSGEDVDGFVRGFELSFDGLSWAYTEARDSVFRFEISAGSDTTDITFFVRAIDDAGLVDPTPAQLIVPIRNSPPEVEIDRATPLPDSAYVLFSLSYVATDLDGAQSLDSVFIQINDGVPVGIPPNFQFLTLVPENPTQSGPQSAQLLLGADATNFGRTIPGLNVGGENQIILFARDITGSLGPGDTSTTVYIRPQASDLLLLDVHSDPTVDQFYREVIDRTGNAYDYRDLANDLPAYWEPTFSRYLQLYDRVVWYSDGVERQDQGGQQLLEIAANGLLRYLNQGGKLLVSTRFPNSFTGEKNFVSPFFGFAPADSFSSSPGQARLLRDSLVRPLESSYPPLQSGGTITGLDPFYPDNQLNALYEADIATTGGWTGPNIVGGRTFFTNGETNQLFFSVELHRLDGDPTALEQLFDYALNTVFVW